MPESAYDRMIRRRSCIECKHGNEHNIDTVGYTGCHPLIGACINSDKWEPYIDNTTCCRNCKHGNYHTGVICVNSAHCLGLGCSTEYNLFDRWHPVTTEELYVEFYMNQPPVMPDEPMRWSCD